MTTTYVSTTELPESIQQALKSVGYGRKDIGIEPDETVSMQTGAAGAGRRAFVVLVDIATGRSERYMGSWGGANMFNPGNAVDLDSEERAIHVGLAVIKGAEGGDRPVYATIHLHPDNVVKLLPAKPTLTERELLVLGTFNYKGGSYRKAEQARLNVTEDELANLVRKGLISRNRAGSCQLTTAGRNARPPY